MDTIWKFPITVADEFTLRMPRGTNVLAVGVQHGVAVMWAQVQTDAENEDRRFFVRGTGYPVEPGWRHLGSFSLHQGDFIGHVFEEPR